MLFSLFFNHSPKQSKHKSQNKRQKAEARKPHPAKQRGTFFQRKKKTDKPLAEKKKKTPTDWHQRF